MDASLKRPIYLTVGLVIVLVVILVISGSNTSLNVFSIIIILGLIALVWFKFFKEKNSLGPSPIDSLDNVTSMPKQAPPKEDQLAEDEDVRTRTGAPCEKAGLYVCKDHPKRTVSMKEGNRFPPCRGDKKGHSTVWILKE